MEEFEFQYKNGQGYIKQIGNMKIGLPCLIYNLLQKVEIDPDRGCWLWTGKLRHNGYGAIKYETRELTAHRFYYWVFRGHVPDDKVCCHSCDVRRCVNPAHIWLGTREENQKDMKDKGRAAKGTRNGSNKLTDAQVIEIKSLLRMINQRDIAEKFGVSQSLVSKIKLGKLWSHL